MATHQPGIVVEILGIKKGDHGWSCKEHEACGKVVVEETLVPLQKVQVMVNGKEEIAIAAIWVTDGVEYCHVGFFGHHMVAHANHYHGALVQVRKFWVRILATVTVGAPSLSQKSLVCLCNYCVLLVWGEKRGWQGGNKEGEGWQRGEREGEKEHKIWIILIISNKPLLFN
jgi:hypothetical protein